MTQMETLELLGNQILQLAAEIKKMIISEDYQGVEDKLEYKENLISKFVNAKKTTEQSPEDEQRINLLIEKIREQEHANITLLKELRHSGEGELKNTKDKIKINSAYEIHDENNQGQYFDLIE